MTLTRLRRIDWTTVVSSVALVAIGIMLLNTTTATDTSGFDSKAVQQAVLGVVGLLVALAMAQIDYDLLRGIALPMFGIGLIALVIVLVVGDTSLGARRWIDLGAIVIQPSEIMKVAAIVFFAKHLSERNASMQSIRTVLASLGVMLIPMALIFLEPDLGTSLVFAAIWTTMVFVAGARWWHLLAPMVVSLAAFPFGWFFAQGYMRERLVTFFDPTNDPLGSGYNVLQARISIGSGGWFGQGIGMGTQSQLEFLRVRDTDFIFAMLGEQLGLIGTLGVLMFFTILIMQAVMIGLRARDSFGQLLAIGVATMLFAQSFVNIGMNVGLMPVTGITLPLVSFGKNSLITTLMSIGILLSVHSHRLAAPYRQQSVQLVPGTLASHRSRSVRRP